MLAETVFHVFFNINGIVPNFMLAFAIAYAAYERSLKAVVWVSVICGVTACASSADEFIIVMISFAAGAALTYLSYDAPHRPAGAVRACIGAAVVTAAENLLLYMFAALSFDLYDFLYRILPVTLINAVCTLIIYAAITKSFGIKNTNKKLIIS